MDSIEELRRLQRDFVRERNWEQFHSPKIAQMNPLWQPGLRQAKTMPS